MGGVFSSCQPQQIPSPELSPRWPPGGRLAFCLRLRRLHWELSHRLGAEVGEVVLYMREKEPSLRDTASQARPWLEP